MTIDPTPGRQDAVRAPGAGGEPIDTGPSPDATFAGSIGDEIISQSVDAMIITDRAFLVRVWNPAAERLYGIAAADAVGRPIEALLRALEVNGQPIDRAAAASALNRDGVWRQRVVQHPLTGSRVGRDVTVSSIVTVLHDRDGAPSAVLAVNRDVTAAARLDSEMAALGTIVLATGQSRTKTHVAETALELLCRATGADAGLVTSSDETYEAIGIRNVSPETVAVILAYGQLGGPLAHALREPEAVISADVATAPLREDVREAVLADGIRHLIIVGLRLQDRLVGIVALGWRHESPSEPSQSVLLQAAAAIASSLENARLLQAVESGLSEERLLTRRMRALVELTRLPDALGTGRTAVERLLVDLRDVIGADGTCLSQVIDDQLVLGPVHRIDPDWARPLLERPLSSAPMAAPLVNGAQSLLASLDPGHLSPAAAAAMDAKGYRTIAAFAIRDASNLVAILIAVFREPVAELELDERTLDAIGRVLDISFANQRLREEILAGERRYRELFESSPDALIVQSVDEVVVDANPAAVRLYGEPLIGQPVDRLVVEDPTAPNLGVVNPLGFTQYTGIGRRLDGSTFPEEVDLRPIEIAGVPRTLVIVRDLTERSRMQGELVQAQKMEAIGLLVAGVAHELNNPLAAIVGFSHLIRTDPALPPDLRHQAELLVQEANRTRNIVQNLLDFARQSPPERIETDLGPLVESVMSLQSYILSRNSLTVEVDIPDDIPRLSIDRSQIQQVLVNLTVNAAQAISELGRPGTIRIQARTGMSEDGPTVRIAISDDGPGVAPTMRDRLFVPFVTSKQPGEGTGLGLSVSFGIVAGHGGTLRHEPNPGGGAVFVMELPTGRTIIDGAGAVDGPRSSPPPPVTPSPPTSGAATAGAATTGARPPTDAGRDRILVLDDEPSIREFLARVLSRSGYEPVLAMTGQAALDIVTAEPPAAILCDHRMAGMTGTEFYDAVVLGNPELGRRFAFMSGDVLNPELRRFAGEHGVQLLAKPFDIAAVAAVVERLLAGRA